MIIHDLEFLHFSDEEYDNSHVAVRGGASARVLAQTSTGNGVMTSEALAVATENSNSPIALTEMELLPVSGFLGSQGSIARSRGIGGIGINTSVYHLPTGYNISSHSSYASDRDTSISVL